MDAIKVILPAGRIPQGATVTKRTGTKTYTLFDEIRIWPINATGSREEREAADPTAQVRFVKASPGTRFLMDISRAGNASAIPMTLELIWATKESTLLSFLRKNEMEDK